MSFLMNFQGFLEFDVLTEPKGEGAFGEVARR